MANAKYCFVRIVKRLEHTCSAHFSFWHPLFIRRQLWRWIHCTYI